MYVLCDRVSSHSSPLGRRQASSLAQRISEHQQTIRRLQSARTDRLRGFGEWMPQVIQAINRAGQQFTHKPLGPIGKCAHQLSRVFLMLPIGLV